MGFDGFPPGALDFLAGLARNNDRAWFADHRDEYEQLLLEPARDLVVAVGEELDRRGVVVNAEPRVNGSIFRINRDTRFSKDKSPYKTYLDLWFWQGEGPSRLCPGFFFRLEPDGLVLGAGRHHFEPPLLARYREAVVDREQGAALVQAVERVEAAGYDIGNRGYKRMPAGYVAADGRRAAPASARRPLRVHPSAAGPARGAYGGAPGPLRRPLRRAGTRPGLARRSLTHPPPGKLSSPPCRSTPPAPSPSCASFAS